MGQAQSTPTNPGSVRRWISKNINTVRVRTSSNSRQRSSSSLTPSVTNSLSEDESQDSYPALETTNSNVPGNFKWMEGRVFTNDPDSSYFMPVDDEEANRLNTRHFMFKTAAGSNYMAPIKSTLSKNNTKVLDVGCGTGLWVTEMAVEFPQANFIGLDVTEQFSKNLSKPSNVTLLIQNALDGLPFEDDSIDYVVQRCMFTSWTKSQWSYIVREMVRVLKPGGYLEMCEIDVEGHSHNDLGNDILSKVCTVMDEMTLDPYVARRLPTFLAMRSLRQINSTFFSMPFKWGGWMGELNEKTVRQALLSMKPKMMISMGADEAQFNAETERSIVLYNATEAYLNVHMAWGRKSKSAK